MPDYPIKSTLTRYLATAVQDAHLEAAGRLFYDGVYRVGPRIEPGTYYTLNVTNCYWERLDSAGNIIANNFVSDAPRVEVTIYASDYAFHASGCGEWKPVGD